MINKATIVGRVGGDPKVFEGKSKMVTFSVATDSGYGEAKQTIWENVKVYGKAAEACETYVKKGMLVFVSGRREANQGKDGKQYINVVADEVKFLDKPGDKSEARKPPARLDPGADTDDGIPY